MVTRFFRFPSFWIAFSFKLTFRAHPALDLRLQKGSHPTAPTTYRLPHRKRLRFIIGAIVNQRIQILDRLIPALPKDCDVKRHGILNGPLSGHLARLGHTHTVVIADAGLPIPEGVPCVDLAVVPGLPAMLPVLDALLAELCIEATTLAEELPVKSPSFHDAIVERLDTLDRLSPTPIARQQLSHEAFKAALPEASVIVRTGECTPYANVILHCGVPF